MISGPVIALLTVVVIFGFVLLVFLSDRMEVWAGDFYCSRSRAVQYLLLVPGICLWLLFRLIDIVVFFCALFAGYQVATGTRNWWNKRP